MSLVSFSKVTKKYIQSNLSIVVTWQISSKYRQVALMERSLYELCVNQDQKQMTTMER